MIIINDFSSLNVASSVRMLSTARGIKDNDIDVSVINIGCLPADSMVSNYCGVPIITLCTFRNRYLRAIISLVKVIDYLKNNDLVFIQITNPIILKWFFLFKHRRSFYIIERTEFPNLSRKKHSHEDIYRKFDLILTISQAIKKYFIRIGISEDKVYVYPMIVDPHRFEIAKDVSINRHYFAYCGDFGGNKDGLGDLIDSFAIFAKNNSDIDLYLIGDTKNDEITDYYKNKVVQLNLSNRVVFTGRVSREDVPRYLVNADALVLARPNNYQAQGGFPTKLGEYLATGNPVVITRTGEIDSFLTDNIDCFFVEPNNPQLFAEKLLFVAQNPKIAEAVGKNGQKKVYNEFNYKVQTQLLMQFVQSLRRK